MPAFERELMDLFAQRIYVLDRGGRIIRANSAAHGPDGRVDEARCRELEELARLGGCPPGFKLVRSDLPGDGRLMIIELRGKIDRDHAPRTLARHHGLTARQAEVYVLWVRGWNEGQVADELKIARHTVKEHLKQIRLKLGVKTKSKMMEMVREFEAGMRRK